MYVLLRTLPLTILGFSLDDHRLESFAVSDNLFLGPLNLLLRQNKPKGRAKGSECHKVCDRALKKLKAQLRSVDVIRRHKDGSFERPGPNVDLLNWVSGSIDTLETLFISPRAVQLLGSLLKSTPPVFHDDLQKLAEENVTSFLAVGPDTFVNNNITYYQEEAVLKYLLVKVANSTTKIKFKSVMFDQSERQMKHHTGYLRRSAVMKVAHAGIRARLGESSVGLLMVEKVMDIVQGHTQLRERNASIKLAEETREHARKNAVYEAEQEKRVADRMMRDEAQPQAESEQLKDRLQTAVDKVAALLAQLTADSNNVDGGPFDPALDDLSHALGGVLKKRMDDSLFDLKFEQEDLNEPAALAQFNVEQYLGTYAPSIFLTLLDSMRPRPVHATLRSYHSKLDADLDYQDRVIASDLNVRCILFDLLQKLAFSNPNAKSQYVSPHGTILAIAAFKASGGSGVVNSILQKCLCAPTLSTLSRQRQDRARGMHGLHVEPTLPSIMNAICLLS